VPEERDEREKAVMLMGPEDAGRAKRERASERESVSEMRIDACSRKPGPAGDLDVVNVVRMCSRAAVTERRVRRALAPGGGHVVVRRGPESARSPSRREKRPPHAHTHMTN